MNEVTTLNKVSKRDFLLKPNEYIKPSKFILTFRGIDKYVVTIEDITTINVTTKPKLQQDVTTTQKRIEKVLTTVPGMATVEEKKPDNIASGNRYTKKFTPNWQRDTSKYGCGCKKEEGQALCTKHGRG